MDSGILLFGLFFLLLFIGVPIAVSLGITSLVFLWQYHLGIQVLAPNFYANIAKFPLLAIPFFILAGFLMDRIGLSRDLVNLLTFSSAPCPGAWVLWPSGAASFSGPSPEPAPQIPPPSEPS
jgi:TRAP-type mannitol/chloroaromatic compound transport system permease large subunit